MNNFQTNIEQELQKYQNIGIIYKRLLDINFIEKFQNFIHETFHSEGEFTIQELRRYSQNIQQKDMIDQFNMNFSIFKCNFILVVQQLIDDIYKAQIKNFENLLQQKQSILQQEFSGINELVLEEDIKDTQENSYLDIPYNENNNQKETLFKKIPKLNLKPESLNVSSDKNKKYFSSGHPSSLDIPDFNQNQIQYQDNRSHQTPFNEQSLQNSSNIIQLLSKFEPIENENNNKKPDDDYINQIIQNKISQQSKNQQMKKKPQFNPDELNDKINSMLQKSPRKNLCEITHNHPTIYSPNHNKLKIQSSKNILSPSILNNYAYSQNYSSRKKSCQESEDLHSSQINQINTKKHSLRQSLYSENLENQIYLQSKTKYQNVKFSNQMKPLSSSNQNLRESYQQQNLSKKTKSFLQAGTNNKQVQEHDKKPKKQQQFEDFIRKSHQLQ